MPENTIKTSLKLVKRSKLIKMNPIPKNTHLYTHGQKLSFIHACLIKTALCEINLSSVRGIGNCISLFLYRESLICHRYLTEDKYF